MAAASSVSRNRSAATFEGGLPRLLEPELLLPQQFFGSAQNRILEGERRLMLAILEDAVSCFQKYAGTSTHRGERLFSDAEAWFFEETDTGWPFSFESICGILDINPEYFRRSLLKWKTKLLDQAPEDRSKIGRVRLRAARRHKILPFVPRRRKDSAKKDPEKLAS